jgi:hypothetical protein
MLLAGLSRGDLATPAPRWSGLHRAGGVAGLSRGDLATPAPRWERVAPTGGRSAPGGRTGRQPPHRVAPTGVADGSWPSGARKRRPQAPVAGDQRQFLAVRGQEPSVAKASGERSDAACDEATTAAVSARSARHVHRGVWLDWLPNSPSADLVSGRRPHRPWSRGGRRAVRPRWADRTARRSPPLRTRPAPRARRARRAGRVAADSSAATCARSNPMVAPSGSCSSSGESAVASNRRCRSRSRPAIRCTVRARSAATRSSATSRRGPPPVTVGPRRDARARSRGTRRRSW